MLRRLITDLPRVTQGARVRPAYQHPGLQRPHWPASQHPNRDHIGQHISFLLLTIAGANWASWLAHNIYLASISASRTTTHWPGPACHPGPASKSISFLLVLTMAYRAAYWTFSLWPRWLVWSAHQQTLAAIANMLFVKITYCSKLLCSTLGSPAC